GPSRPAAPASSAEAPPQLPFQNFPRGIARQRVDDLDLLGDLLAHDAATLHESADLGDVEGAAGLARHDAGSDALAAGGVGQADHGGLGDGGVLVQDVFDALGAEVLALANDDVLLP